jgi:two-component system, NarL family, response regulator LiaR
MASGLISVTLVDDHAAVRQGLSVLLERRGFRILASVESVPEAREALARELPDVLVVDLCMPGIDGTTLIREVRATNTDLKVVVFTGSTDPDEVADALHSGADGFAAKAGGIDELVSALRAVRRGQRHLDPRVAAMLDQRSEQEGVLTARESQVLRLLGKGLTGIEVAERLVLSPETVKTHIRNAMARLHARTRVQAVLIAMATHAEQGADEHDLGEIAEPAG